MSFKDLRYFRECPICGDKLPGTDDGLEVFASCKEQLEEGLSPPDYTGDDVRESYGCGLCGERVTAEQLAEVVAKGEPPLMDAVV